MPVFVAEFITQIKNIWAQLSGGQRLTVGAILLATLVGFGALVWVGTRPDYVAFGNQYEGAERAQLIAALEDARIDYRMENKTVLVNSAQESDARKALIRKGLGASGGDEQEEGLLPDRERRRWFLQLKRVRRVERQIRDLSGVRMASVNLNSPPQSVFAQSQKKATASVMISVAPHVSFDRLGDRVVGIVSKSLGVAREDVEVSSSDLRGYRASQGSGGQGYATLLELQAQASHVLTAKARTYLDSVWAGKTHVAVHAEYDNKVVDRQKKLISEDKVLVGETSYKTSDEKNARGASGDPNAAGAAGSGGAANGGAGDKSTVNQVDRQFAPVIGEESVRALAPDLKRISVSLSVDESLSAQKDEIIDQVKSAVGWTDQRDRAITATIVKFPEIDGELDSGGGAMDMVMRYGPLAGQILSVLFVLMFLRGLLKKAKIETNPAQQVAEAEAEEDPGQQTRRLRREIERAVASDPASVSRFLETWLSQKPEG